MVPPQARVSAMVRICTSMMRDLGDCVQARSATPATPWGSGMLDSATPVSVRVPQSESSEEQENICRHTTRIPKLYLASLPSNTALLKLMGLSAPLTTVRLLRTFPRRHL